MIETRTNTRFVNRGNKRGEIWLYDYIGKDRSGGGISSKEFIADMTKLGTVDTINLRINSLGGDVNEGLAIYNNLVRHPARIEVDIDAVAASIASVVAMAGDEIRMAENAQIMIHEPSKIEYGGAADMRKAAEMLDRVKGIIVDTYVKRTGGHADEIAAMMADETWMTAAEAVELGFADTVTAEQRIAACYGMDFSNFKNVPKMFLEQGSSVAARTMRPRRDMASVKLAAMGKRIAR